MVEASRSTARHADNSTLEPIEEGPNNEWHSGLLFFQRPEAALNVRLQIQFPAKRGQPLEHRIITARCVQAIFSCSALGCRREVRLSSQQVLHKFNAAQNYILYWHRFRLHDYGAMKRRTDILITSRPGRLFPLLPIVLYYYSCSILQALLRGCFLGPQKCGRGAHLTRPSTSF